MAENEINKKGEMSLDKLAQMIQRGFSATATKEDVVAVNGRLSNVESRMDGFENKLDAMDMMLKSVKDDLKEIKSDVSTVNMDYLELRTRVERLEKKVGLRK